MTRTIATLFFEIIPHLSQIHQTRFEVIPKITGMVLAREDNQGMLFCQLLADGRGSCAAYLGHEFDPVADAAAFARARQLVTEFGAGRDARHIARQIAKKVSEPLQITLSNARAEMNARAERRDAMRQVFSKAARLIEADNTIATADECSAVRSVWGKDLRFAMSSNGYGSLKVEKLPNKVLLEVIDAIDAILGDQMRKKKA